MGTPVSQGAGPLESVAVTTGHATHPSSRGIAEPSYLARAMVLVLGASVFAYLFGVVVHEFGHYIGAAIADVPVEGIVLHPFDLSYNDYGDLRGVSQLRLAIESAAGPVLNLFVGAGVSLFVWRRRSARWLPVVMWGPLALLQEGVGMIIGLVDYPNLESDWVSVMKAGVPPAMIGLSVAVLLVAGSVWILLLMPLAGISAEDPYWTKLVVFLAGVPLLMLGAVVYLAVIGSSVSSPAGMAQQNRSIALGASVALVASLTALHRPLFARLDRISHTQTSPVSWRDAGLAVAMGAAVFVFMLTFYN